MIQRKQLQVAGNTVSQNPTVWLPLMIGYKTGIQKAILNIATKDELLDVKNCRINQSMISKLCQIANKELHKTYNAETLFSLSIAVATIIKEYNWGTYYLIDEGLLELADRIQNT